jgi:FtsH-binding integral membrane protein
MQQERAVLTDPMMTIPAPAFWLGWAGVIPFAGLTGLSLVGFGSATGPSSVVVLQALVTYGMIILSFMGGVQWGLEMTGSDGHHHSALGFAASVVPALVAFGVSFVQPLVALVILALGFIGLLAYDLRRIKAGVGPRWYAGLRLQLSTAVVLCLGVAVAANLSSVA